MLRDRDIYLFTTEWYFIARRKFLRHQSYGSVLPDLYFTVQRIVASFVTVGSADKEKTPLPLCAFETNWIVCEPPLLFSEKCSQSQSRYSPSADYLTSWKSILNNKRLKTQNFFAYRNVTSNIPYLRLISNMFRNEICLLKSGTLWKFRTMKTGLRIDGNRDKRWDIR